MKVCVADVLPQHCVELLERAGHAVRNEPELSQEDLARGVDAQVLVVRSTKVTEAAIRASTNLELIVRAGAGTNTIDVGAASAAGVFVANTPGKNAIAVAELTMGLLVSADRHVGRADAALKADHWDKKQYGAAQGLYGRTLGILGLGQIGVEVAQRARAFGMRVVAWSRSLTPERGAELGITALPSPLEVARQAHAVTVHVSYGTATHHLLGAEFLAALRPGAIVVNTSRGGVVDENALLAALDEKGLWYATDVFENEPAGGTAAWASALAKHPRATATPHIGASTEQAQEAVAKETVRIVLDFAKSGVVHHCVNLCAQSPAKVQLVVRHFDRVGVLANVLGAIREAGINVEEVQNIIFDGAKTACARIQLAEEPNGTLVEAIRGHEHVIGARLVRLA